MSESGDGRPAGAAPTHDVGPRQDDGTGAGTAAARHGNRPGGGGRRWLWVVLGVLVVAAVVVLVLLLTNGRRPPESAQTLEPEIVTLPVPTPTVDPVDLPEGTAFFEALPRTVLQFAVAEAGEDEELARQGALEAYRFVFDDGAGEGVTLVASQWRAAEDAARRLEDVVAQQSAEAGTEPSAPAPAAGADDDTGAAEDDEDATDDPVTQPRLETGPVVVEDSEVGSFLLRVREDGTATLWWTNTTALLRLDGPADVVRDVYAAFPL